MTTTNGRCQRCGAESPDLRTLLINCLYDLSETGMPFKVYDHIASDGRTFYALRICKDCRGLFIRALMEWFGQEAWPNGVPLDDKKRAETRAGRLLGPELRAKIEAYLADRRDESNQ